MTRKATAATPKKAPRRGSGAKADAWRPKFLELLAESCNVTFAAAAAGINRKTAYRHREADGAFAEDWDDAIEQGVEALEYEARRRALYGTERPIVHQGNVVATVHEYSDTLTIFLLKAHRPDKYRDRVEHTGKDGGAIEIRFVNDWRAHGS